MGCRGIPAELRGVSEHSRPLFRRAAVAADLPEHAKGCNLR